ncbi:MAG: 7-carboxy-7-deazaguanine synthase QueE [Planctomycetaceae bacterium]|jgi:7-carboxy-7-deazaguanine synthase|nr:7-carboxy-7-deazaguanine synthase QueE [Planctomycetaceae bacterium]
MRILEIYQSKQGEGIWTGHYSVFVRVLGCPLRCRYCDTVYARDEQNTDAGADLSAEEIVGRILLLDLHDVVLTGGEPMMTPEIVELTRLLKEYDYQITVETSGIAFHPVVCDLMSISPKLKNSVPLYGEQLIRDHEAARSKPEIIQQLLLRYNCQLKFVVDTKEDLHEIESYLSQFHGIAPDRILLMPQAVDTAAMYQKAAWIERFCEERGFRYCPRMQLIWYGNKRGT